MQELVFSDVEFLLREFLITFVDQTVQVGRRLFFFRTACYQTTAHRDIIALFVFAIYLEANAAILFLAKPLRIFFRERISPTKNTELVANKVMCFPA